MAEQADTRGAEQDFARSTHGFRRELLAHCYRLLGSVDDAEDLVQETYLRAWRAYDRFEGRSSVRTWLYQIATRACLTALQHSSRRQLPSGLGRPGEDRALDLDTGDSTVSWLQPMPDTLVNPESGDPQTIAVHRESLRLALIASLQYLPPRQRAVLLLRDVLAFPAGEVATILGTTTVAVKSALQRARARLDEVAPTPEQVTEPSEPAVRAQLEQYIAAFVEADAAGLQRLLLADTTLELLPSPTWYAGSEAAARATAGLGSPGDWRMIPTTANGQPAVAAYLRGPDGVHRAFGIVVLTTAAAGIARITVFAEPALLVAFGLPPFHPPPRAHPAHPAHRAAADRPGGPNSRPPEEKTTMTTDSTPRTDEADDAIRTLFAEVARAWADGDADTFAQWYADDATVILPGYHLPGRKAIREAMGAAFAGPLHGTRRIHEVLGIRYLDADTALVITRSATVPSAGTEVPEHLRERATWALSRRHGHWLVEAYHSCPETVLGTS